MASSHALREVLIDRTTLLSITVSSGSETPVWPFCTISRFSKSASTTTKPSEIGKVLDCRIQNGHIMIANLPVAENHHPGGIGPPESANHGLSKLPLLS